MRSLMWMILSCLIVSGSSLKARRGTSFERRSARKLFDDYHEQYLILFPLEATAFGDNRYNDHCKSIFRLTLSPRKKQFYTQTLERLTAIDRSGAMIRLRLAADVLEYELKSRAGRNSFQL